MGSGDGVGEGAGLGRPGERAEGAGRPAGRGAGEGEARRTGGRGPGPAAVAAQAHLGERGEGRGVSRRLTCGGEERSRGPSETALPPGLPLVPFRARGVAATTSGPAPALPANSRRLPRTAVQKPFRLETRCLIGSREAGGRRALALGY